MSGYFSVCSTYMYQHRYMDFLLANYKELNMPYPFPVTLSYISSPLLIHGGAILYFDDEDEPAGALGYIYGTGENDYEDRHVIQIQVAFLTEQNRGSRLFLEGLCFLIQHLAEQADAELPQEIHFWTAKDVRKHRLFSKFAKQSENVEGEYGGMSGYKVSLAHLRTYITSLSRDRRVRVCDPEGGTS
ncbi:hypothetical protein [Paenibacillus tundrae]|uniref:GNAT family N-acetyltransferase n=1 Tax=Paenibacillus tundrae TaxID=528187 RepID=A0ABT9WDA2_9BACL|nr:hypothetical protein [Paenibacillus tundrae]MDQ0171249.1 hypothetical protein [Paenibacillus tundrae]